MIPAADYPDIFDNVSGLYLILRPDPPRFTILDFNRARAKGTRTSKATAVGKGLFDIFPDNPGDPHATGARNLTSSLMKVLETCQPHRMRIQKYDIPIPGTEIFEERYWSPENIPVLDPDGSVKYIIHVVTDVTSQVLLERREQKAQAEISKLSLILSKATNAVVLADSRERIQWVNSAFEDLFDLSAGEVIGKSFLELLLSLADEDAHAAIRQAVTLRQATECEISNQASRGKWIASRLDIQPLFESSGKIHTFFAVATDISAIRKAETIIFENEQRSQFILANISDGIIILDERGRIREVSAAGMKMLEWGADELVNRKRPDLVHPEDLRHAKKCFRDILEGSVVETSRTFRFRLPDGNFKWLACTFQNFINESAIHGIVLTFRDVTERMEKDELLRASETNYRYLFDNNPAGILLWDPVTYKIVESNQTARELTRYDKEELQRMTVFDIHPPAEHAVLSAIPEQLRERAFVNSNQPTQIVTSTGRTLYTDSSYHNITFYQRELVLGMIVDVTEKVALEKQIRLERDRKHHEVTDAVLTAQENERSHLGRELHDNVNQILTTARLFLEHALAGENNSAALMQNSRDLVASAIAEVRELSRSLVPAALEVHGLVHTVDELLEKVRLLNKIKINSAYTFAEDRLSGKFRLAIFRIIQEQLNNIIKHAAATCALVAIRKEGNDLVVIVRDNGTGFDPDCKSDGLGFKNITSRALVHHGVVTINSSPGKGCELRVRFSNALA